MSRFVKLILFLCFIFGLTGNMAYASTKNWCGVYFESHNRGYIKVLRNDIGVGSDRCSLVKYNERKRDERAINIVLKFTKNDSTVANWRKFSNHLIEVRGKYRNGVITGTKFIRDLGR